MFVPVAIRSYLKSFCTFPISLYVFSALFLFPFVCSTYIQSRVFIESINLYAILVVSFFFLPVSQFLFSLTFVSSFIFSSKMSFRFTKSLIIRLIVIIVLREYLQDHLNNFKIPNFVFNIKHLL